MAELALEHEDPKARSLATNTTLHNKVGRTRIPLLHGKTGIKAEDTSSTRREVSSVSVTRVEV